MKTFPVVFVSSPTVKKEGDHTIVIAAGVDAIRKIKASGEAFDLVSVPSLSGS
jgi:hypothetical protein